MISSCVFVQCNNTINNIFFFTFVAQEEVPKSKERNYSSSSNLQNETSTSSLSECKSCLTHTHICILFHSGFVFIYIFLEHQNLRKQERFFKNNKIYKA